MFQYTDITLTQCYLRLGYETSCNSDIINANFSSYQGQRVNQPEGLFKTSARVGKICELLQKRCSRTRGTKIGHWAS